MKRHVGAQKSLIAFYLDHRDDASAVVLPRLQMCLLFAKQSKARPGHGTSLSAELSEVGPSGDTGDSCGLLWRWVRVWATGGHSGALGTRLGRTPAEKARRRRSTGDLKLNNTEGREHHTKGKLRNIRRAKCLLLAPQRACSCVSDWNDCCPVPVRSTFGPLCPLSLSMQSRRNFIAFRSARPRRLREKFSPQPPFSRPWL